VDESSPARHDASDGLGGGGALSLTSSDNILDASSSVASSATSAFLENRLEEKSEGFGSNGSILGYKKN